MTQKQVKIKKEIQKLHLSTKLCIENRNEGIDLPPESANYNRKCMLAICLLFVLFIFKGNAFLHI